MRGRGERLPCLQELRRPCDIRGNDKVPHCLRGTSREQSLPSRLAWSEKASGRKVDLGGGGQLWPESLLRSIGLGDVAGEVSLGGN